MIPVLLPNMPFRNNSTSENDTITTIINPFKP